MSGGALSKTITLSPLFMAYNKTKVVEYEPTLYLTLLIVCLLHLQDEMSFRLDVPMDGDSVDEETGTHDVMMTVPPNQVQLSYTRISVIFPYYLCYEFAQHAYYYGSSCRSGLSLVSI